MQQGVTQAFTYTPGHKQAAGAISNSAPGNSHSFMLQEENMARNISSDEVLRVGKQQKITIVFLLKDWFT